MKDFLLQKGIELALPLILGLITPRIMDLLKKASAWLDNAPATVKQVMVFVITGVATATAHALGIAIPTDLSAWDAQLVSTVLGGLLAIAMKQQTQVKKLKANLNEMANTVAVPSAPVDPASPFYIPPGTP